MRFHSHSTSTFSSRARHGARVVLAACVLLLAAVSAGLLVQALGANAVSGLVVLAVVVAAVVLLALAFSGKFRLVLPSDDGEYHQAGNQSSPSLDAMKALDYDMRMAPQYRHLGGNIFHDQ